MTNRIKIIDYLKTSSIIGIVLFHGGLLTNGYLGVEVFFVISGYLFIKSNRTKFEDGTFNPIKFLTKKLSEFWPLIVAAGAISLIIGYFGMLPDDYENLSESIVASNLFANNVLQAITTKNYWDVVNTYKPFMHTWYIGVLFQSYIFFAIVLFAARKIRKKDYTCTILIGLSIISLVLFLIPVFNASDKFYYFPFRLFEISAGGILAFLPRPKMKDTSLRFLGKIGMVILIIILFANINASNTILLLLTVAVTCLVLFTHLCMNVDYGMNGKVSAIISLPGKYSYDIYIWHQVAIAFLYYFVFQELNVWLVVLVFVITISMSFVSVSFRKKCLVLSTIKSRIILSIILMIVTCTASMYVYMHAGVTRNVPELGIDGNNVHRNMHAQYVNIPYSWDKDFEDKSKIHVLVMGNSFGRDFANILKESAISDQLEISYIFGDNAADKMNRVEEADFVFYGVNSWGISNWITQNVDSDKLYIVGNKKFGNSNGIIYINRNQPWYFDQRVALSDDFIRNNNTLRKIYGNHYIDMITPLLDENRISVFTDDHFYISQDCRHLTKQGAQYYSRILDLSFIVRGGKNYEESIK